MVSVIRIELRRWSVVGDGGDGGWRLPVGSLMQKLRGHGEERDMCSGNDIKSDIKINSIDTRKKTTVNIPRRPSKWPGRG